MARATTQKVRFRRFSAKALVTQLVGQEPPYPVYFVGRTIKYELPEASGQTYRRYRNFP